MGPSSQYDFFFFLHFHFSKFVSIFFFKILVEPVNDQVIANEDMDEGVDEEAVANTNQIAIDFVSLQYKDGLISELMLSKFKQIPSAYFSTGPFVPTKDTPTLLSYVQKAPKNATHSFDKYVSPYFCFFYRSILIHCRTVKMFVVDAIMAFVTISFIYSFGRTECKLEELATFRWYTVKLVHDLIKKEKLFDWSIDDEETIPEDRADLWCETVAKCDQKQKAE